MFNRSITPIPVIPPVQLQQQPPNLPLPLPNPSNPFVAAAIAGINQSEATLNAIRQSKRLYVGNIPLGITEDELGQFFNETFVKNNALTSPGDAVVSVQINVEKNYAFIEVIFNFVSFFLFYFIIFNTFQVLSKKKNKKRKKLYFYFIWKKKKMEKSFILFYFIFIFYFYI
jgi:hypothetical protein